MAKVAVVIAFLYVLLLAVASLRQPLAILSAIIPLWAGIGVLLRRTWSAYGYALASLTSILVIPLVVDGAGNVLKFQLLLGAAVAAVAAVIFFFAGRSLAQSGAKRGLAWPWVLLSLLQTVPFVFFHAYVMPTGSMENTLIIGDHLVVQQFPRAKVSDGDIVVFHYPIDPAQTFIKRIVGMPGDHIRMVSRAVYRNGSLLAEPYAVHKFSATAFSRDNFPLNISDAPYSDNQRTIAAMSEMISKHVASGDLIVPPGKYFVLGDNRDNSLDSRYWGLLDESEIIGKPVLIYYSPGHWDRLMKLL